MRLVLTWRRLAASSTLRLVARSRSWARAARARARRASSSERGPTPPRARAAASGAASSPASAPGPASPALDVPQGAEVLALLGGERPFLRGSRAPAQAQDPLVQGLAEVGGAQRIRRRHVAGLAGIGLQVEQALLAAAGVVEVLEALVAQRVARAVPHRPRQDGRLPGPALHD